MDVDDNELLTQAAAGATLERGAWPALRTDLLERLDNIARQEFPIPKLPPPPTIELPLIDNQGRLVSPLPSSPPEQSSQEADKENAPAYQSQALSGAAPASQDLEPGQLPKQLEDMLTGIVKHLETFHAHPPHTIQRLAELILRPRAHYKALAPYLHAVDRVVMVTSDASVYPLPNPEAAADGSTQATEDDDPASSVNWSNPTNGGLGSDEALGGALLTPIPWVQANKPQPEPLGSNALSSSLESAQGAQIHSESTEKIEGPNGMGSIETVSVSVNGIPSTGHARGVTQGELLRQEQRAGVVPVNQRRNQEHFMTDAERRAIGVGGLDDHPEDGERGVGDEVGEDDDDDEDEEEIPHARGPEEIGVGDTGPQTTTNYSGEGALETQAIDVEAAVGRKHEEEDEHRSPEIGEHNQEDSSEVAKSPAASSDGTSVKREAEVDLESEPTKKLKEGDGVAQDGTEGDEAKGDKTEVEGDQMETDK